MSILSKKDKMSPNLKFKIDAKDGEARAGVLTTRRGRIETPVFMTVGTAVTVKGIRFEALEDNDLDAKIILGNTYHLWLRPGIDVIKSAGGLHRFIGWNRPLLTDSGGFQVWSLGALRKISEEGTEFRSHVDGSLRFLSPEVSMDVQAALGSDIVMVFDECAPGEASPEEAERSLSLTARWAKRSKQAFDRLQTEGADTGRSEAEGLSGTQALFGIIQGAGHLDPLGDRGVAAHGDRTFLAARAGPLDRAPHRLADRLGIDDRLFVDRVRWRRLGRVTLHAIAVAALRQLDQLDRRGRDVETYDRSKPALEQHG